MTAKAEVAKMQAQVEVVEQRKPRVRTEERVQREIEPGTQWRLTEVEDLTSKLNLTWRNGSEIYRESLLLTDDGQKVRRPSHKRFLMILAHALVQNPDRRDVIAADTLDNQVRWIVGRRFEDLSLGDSEWKPEEQQ